MSFEYNRDLNPEDGKCKQCGNTLPRNYHLLYCPSCRKQNIEKILSGPEYVRGTQSPESRR